jgi:uncharacterized protein YndB with AHSA1/START domain
MNFNKLKIEALIEGDRAMVWEAWTNPGHITKWNFATEDWCCPSAENDLRVGGRYKARMEAKDGSFGFDFEATYKEIVPLCKIVLMMTDGRCATTEFVTVARKTSVTTIFDAEKENPEEMQQEGWQQILNNFKRYFEGHCK